MSEDTDSGHSVSKWQSFTEGPAIYTRGQEKQQEKTIIAVSQAPGKFLPQRAGGKQESS